MAKRTFYVVYLPVGWHERKVDGLPDLGYGDYPEFGYWSSNARPEPAQWDKTLNNAHLFKSRAAAKGKATKFNKWLQARAERRGDTAIGRASVAEVEVSVRVTGYEG